MVRAQQRVCSSSSDQAEQDGSVKHSKAGLTSTAAAEVHAVVESDDEDTTAEEYEWGLAQRATDPYFKQRVLKGRFMFVKIAGCEGFHCYESELLERLAVLGVNVSGDQWKQQPVQAAAAAATSSSQVCNKIKNRPVSAENSTGSASTHSSSSSTGRKKNSTLNAQKAQVQPATTAASTTGIAVRA